MQTQTRPDTSSSANPNNTSVSPQALLTQAQQLYRSGENKELEKLFAKFLKKSFDPSFWNIYIDYVKKVSTKKVNLVDVYSFVCNHFEGSYVSYQFIRSYIDELELTEEDNSNADLIRKTYGRSFVPMHNLAVLWNDYEKWEAKVNKHTARGFIDQTHPTFMLAFNTYQRLAPHIESNKIFNIFDIELANPLKLQPRDLDRRLEFLFNFYLSKFPGSEQVSFLFSFYLKDAAKEKIDFKTDNVFLKIWYSFQYNKLFFDMEDKDNRDLMAINYLNWASKNEGIEASRQKFSEIKGKVGPYVFIYVANMELHLARNRKEAYQTFMDGIERFGDNSALNEHFLQMFIDIGDDDNIRLLFKKLRKTERMWEMMAAYEFLYGEVEDYKSLARQRQEDDTVLPPVPAVESKTKSGGCQGIYETVIQSVEYLDLKISQNNILSDFISKLPMISQSENIFSNLDNFKVVELLSSLCGK